MANTEMPEGEAPEQGADEKETTLVPKSMFGGDCEVGDTYTVKVVGKFEDELEIEHVPDKDKDKSKPDTMEGAMGKMDMMAESESY